MKYIPLSQGKFAIVDDEDFELVSQYKWYYHQGYAVTHGGQHPNQFTLSMHRLILNKGFGNRDYTDHINGNKLDNRRANLRICTNAQNCRNRTINTNNTSGYKGVSWNKANKKWTAYIKLNWKLVFLGNFVNKEDAAIAYDKAAQELYGEFARLNFPTI